MNKYYKLLGLNLDDVKNHFDKINKKYTIQEIKGFKDQQKLINPRVIKITEKNDSIEIITTYFSIPLA